MVNIEREHGPLGAFGETDTAAGDSAPARSTVRRLLCVATGGVVLCAVIAFSVGFVHFVDSISRMERPAGAERADAIVALTGGADRITDAMALLGEGRAQRLLISGVHPSTTREALASLTPAPDTLFNCCVDLGHSALNTVGNAKEARDWARGNGFHSLIVVTSSYHLPRSLNEIAREIPEARLIPYAVINDRVKIDDWWREPGTARLLLSEFTKYLMSLARVRFSEPTSFADMTRSAAAAPD